jgi:Lon protease-like protein
MDVISLIPLSSIVLPNGKINVRIFESRYLRMLRECYRYDTGFGICLINDNKVNYSRCISRFGTLVEVVDFGQLENGFLVITVVGRQRFRILRSWSESDGLRKAEIERLENWHCQSLQEDNVDISIHLDWVYHQFPQIGELYPTRYLHDASWVSQRWLELLPLDITMYEELIGQDNCLAATRFITMTLRKSAS